MATANEVNFFLESACARNLAVEIHLHASTDELLVAKSRVLKLDRALLYLDRPKNVSQPLLLRAGCDISIYVSLNGHWHMFRAKVDDPQCRIRLSKSKSVVGLSVSRPRLIAEQQRRETFRVSLACVSPIDAELHETSPTQPDQVPLNAVRFHARLVDVSAGGLAIRVDKTNRNDFCVAERCFITFQLPDGGSEMTLLVEVRHFHDILDGEAVRVGLKFLRWNEAQTRHQLRRIARFTAQIQRQSLQHAAH